MVYTIINPSDAYTLESNDRVAACLAALLLGHGKYALDSNGDNFHFPLFLFSSEDDIREWFRKELAVEDCFAEIEKRLVPIAEALESVLLCDTNQRADFFEALSLIDDPKKREQWRESWHDRRRSSMNDIGRRAWRIAENLRNKAAAAAENEA